MKGIIEGLLYVQGDLGLTIEQVSEVLEITEEEAKQLILSLKQDYINEDRGLRINYLGNCFKLTTKVEHKEYYQKLLDNPKNNTLSNQALETLAIIAYNEPITRLMVDEIRGVSSREMIKKLVAKGLVKEVGRSELPGRPILYQTTSEFLDYFGLASKDELPKFDNIVEEVTIDSVDLYDSKYKEEIDDAN